MASVFRRRQSESEVGGWLGIGESSGRIKANFPDDLYLPDLAVGISKLGDASRAASLHAD